MVVRSLAQVERWWSPAGGGSDLFGVVVNRVAVVRSVRGFGQIQRGCSLRCEAAVRAVPGMSWFTYGKGREALGRGVNGAVVREGVRWVVGE